MIMDDRLAQARARLNAQSVDTQKAETIYLAKDFQAGGVLATNLPGYQPRAAQVDMAKKVEQSLAESRTAIIEAATGTGKSIGYLIPVIRDGRKAIVSTSNKALQDQIFNKDIPFLQRYLGYFSAELAKGKGNYICLDHLGRFEAKGDGANELFKVQHYVANQEDFTGDFETLPFSVSPELKAEIRIDSDDCAVSKCPHFNDCFFYQAKKRLQDAQVIVTNHSILALNASYENILPAHDIVIIDEAHGLEAITMSALTIQVKASRITRLLALKQVKQHALDGSLEEIETLASQVWLQLEAIYEHASVNGGGVSLDHPIEEGKQLASLIEKLASQVERSKLPGMDDKEEALYGKLVERIQQLAIDLRNVFSVLNTSNYVYHIERETGKKHNQIIIECTPLDVSTFLRESVFEKHTVIATSATLASSSNEQNGFTFIKKRIGLDQDPRLIQRILPPVFDYQHNAMLYIPRGIPDPAYGPGDNARAYEQAIAQEMLQLVLASHGRAFLLFSSRRMLQYVYATIHADIPYPLLVQGESSEISKQFKAYGNAVLFGLKSYWEGVDIAGPALSLVVIDKLPFSPPDSPVKRARVNRMKARGENWFQEYVLAEVVLQLKQGVGRLIRTTEDTGVMAILDARLISKPYGKQVIRALPPARGTTQIDAIRNFYGEDSNYV